MRTNVEGLIAALPRDEAELARTRLDQLERTCACGLGVVCALAALVLYVAGLAFWIDLTVDNAWRFGVVGFAVALIGAGLGKTVGLIRARSQRNRFVDELRARIAALDRSPSGASNATA
jgi:O-antigen ligase